MRPLPGAARMHPETDVPPIRITKEHLDALRLPERPDQKRLRLVVCYQLNDEQIKQLLIHDHEDAFERFAVCFPTLQQVISRTFINIFPELEGEGKEIIDDQLITYIFTALQEDRFSKETVPFLIRYLAEHPTQRLQDALRACGIQQANREEILRIIQRIVSDRKDFIKTQGDRALDPLMGVVMEQLRGKADE